MQIHASQHPTMEQARPQIDQQWKLHMSQPQHRAGTTKHDNVTRLGTPAIQHLCPNCQTSM